MEAGNEPRERENENARRIKGKKKGPKGRQPRKKEEAKRLGRLLLVQTATGSLHQLLCLWLGTLNRRCEKDSENKVRILGMDGKMERIVVAPYLPGAFPIFLFLIIKQVLNYSVKSKYQPGLSESF